MNKKQINTPINSEILDGFRVACAEYGLKMNAVLEALLQDFNNGNYDVVINRDHGIKVIKNK